MRSTTYHLTSQDWWKEKPQSSQPPVYHSPILTPLLNTGDLGSKIMHRTVTKHPANNTQSKETGTRRKWWPRLKALATNRSKSLQSFTAFQIQTEQKWEKKKKKKNPLTFYSLVQKWNYLLIQTAIFPASSCLGDFSVQASYQYPGSGSRHQQKDGSWWEGRSECKQVIWLLLWRATSMGEEYWLWSCEQFVELNQKHRNDDRICHPVLINW